jgi:uncharacterized tellurite resistance protein B-like protein
MASDGHIDKREVQLIKSLCEKSKLFDGLNINEEFNKLVTDINAHGQVFITNYFTQLKACSLSEDEQLILLDFALQTIRADEQIEYSEIKFFKIVRHYLNVSDEAILNHFPGVEQFLEEDIVTESYLDRLTAQYFESAILPTFSMIESLTENDQPNEQNR